ncbi:hypothetical protein Ctob_012267 [Chrysochromulina tobinii]|uniref:Uncharacterized protein n=1 Tax=Chrysochromulina tobinii TaxID=1460289 RepID=A0A0M0JDU0_9EUKA|nr:hypothetical protein Ctob_012267 [Chrysochromulina tobinii]|eukprot:KOO24764.1 hypothetical protein Ctob_012267 [Chrysochromulina sp. CCMP291]
MTQCSASYSWLLLDTQPNMSAAEVTANFSQPYACYNVPQYRTQNMSDWMSIWLGGIISNASNPPDNYCFEKLRLTPSEQFRRGAAWHRATQRLVDGFEILFSFQIDNGALLCKTVRTLVTGVLMYEKCVRSGADVVRGPDGLRAPDDEL